MNNWQSKKLGEIVNIKNGTWGTADTQGTAVLRSTNFTNEGDLSYDNVAYREIQKNKISELSLKKGDILLEKSGGGPTQPVGRVVLYDKEQDKAVVFGNFISRLRPFGIDNKFLFYFLLVFYKKGYTNRLQNQTTGIRNLILKKYLDTEILFPILVIQKQIVEKLDAIKKMQELNQKEIEKAEELLNSYLARAFEPQKRGKIKKLSELFVRGSKTILPVTLGDKLVNYIGLENIESNTGRLVGFSESIAKTIKSAKTKFTKGDTLYGKLRPYLNKVWFATTDGICSTDIWVLKAQESEILPELLPILLRFPEIVKKTLAGMTGTSLPRVNSRVFDNIEVNILPIEKQKILVEEVMTIQAYQQSLQMKKEKLSLLFDSALNKYMKPNQI